jgi:hypothetical protein
MASNKADLVALWNMITEAVAILETTKLPEGRTPRALELLRSALALTDYLAISKPAATLGKRGGTRTAKRGPEYFRKIAAMRKTRSGGRPRKENG